MRALPSSSVHPGRFSRKSRASSEPGARTGNVISGQDKQGGARFQTTMTFRVEDRVDPPGSRIPIEAQVEITGKLASIIETGASMVVKRMTKDFPSNSQVGWQEPARVSCNLQGSRSMMRPQ